MRSVVGGKVNGQILFGARSEKLKIFVGARGEKWKNLFGDKWQLRKVLFGSQRVINIERTEKKNNLKKINLQKLINLINFRDIARFTIKISTIIASYRDIQNGWWYTP